MGRSVSPKCLQCQHVWTGELIGPLFVAHVYRCDTCGASKEVSIDELPEGEQHAWPFWNLTRRQLRTILGSCVCGGAFDRSAPVRCPICHSADVDLTGNPDGVVLEVD